MFVKPLGGTLAVFLDRSLDLHCAEATWSEASNHARHGAKSASEKPCGGPLLHSFLKLKSAPVDGTPGDWA
ncbi:unnamed protein product [Lampetra planeri]